jgi:hypothetical protein
MAHYPYILFDKSPLQLRLLGARGGKACARNQRRRRALIALMSKPREVIPPRAPKPQTTAEAVASLDTQFPWLRCAEKSRRNSGAPGGPALRLSLNASQKAELEGLVRSTS